MAASIHNITKEGLLAIAYVDKRWDFIEKYSISVAHGEDAIGAIALWLIRLQDHGALIAGLRRGQIYLGTTTGRTSSSSPNISNRPKHKEIQR